MEILHGIDPRVILRTYNNDPAEVMKISAIPRISSVTDPLESISYYTLNVDTRKVDALILISDMGWDFYPQEMLETLEEFTVPTGYFKHMITPLYSTQFLVQINQNKIQPIRRENGYTTYKNFAREDLESIFLPDSSSHHIRSAALRILNGITVTKDSIKNLPIGCSLCEMLQAGNVKITDEGNSRIWKISVNLSSNFLPTILYKSLLRDPDIDALFSSPKEIWERDFKTYETTVKALIDDPSSMYAKIGDDLFEVFQTGECEDCGCIAVYGDSVTLHVNEEILKKQGLLFHHEVPPNCWDVSRGDDDGESYEVCLCEYCDREE